MKNILVSTHTHKYSSQMTMEMENYFETVGYKSTTPKLNKIVSLMRLWFIEPVR